MVLLILFKVDMLLQIKDNRRLTGAVFLGGGLFEFQCQQFASSDEGAEGSEGAFHQA
jgi:hypothetical protein